MECFQNPPGGGCFRNHLASEKYSHRVRDRLNGRRPGKIRDVPGRGAQASQSWQTGVADRSSGATDRLSKPA
jgi:hypothetical protein